MRHAREGTGHSYKADAERTELRAWGHTPLPAYGTADEQKSELAAEMAAAETSSAIMMPLALHTIMEDIQTRVKNDLLLEIRAVSEGVRTDIKVPRSKFPTLIRISCGW